MAIDMLISLLILNANFTVILPTILYFVLQN